MYCIYSAFRLHLEKYSDPFHFFQFCHVAAWHYNRHYNLSKKMLVELWDRISLERTDLGKAAESSKEHSSHHNSQMEDQQGLKTLAKMNNQERRALVREVTKNPMETIRPENLVPHSLRVLRVLFWKLQAGFHVFCTEKKLLLNHSAIKPRSLKSCSDGCPWRNFVPSPHRISEAQSKWLLGHFSSATFIQEATVLFGTFSCRIFWQPSPGLCLAVILVEYV